MEYLDFAGGPAATVTSWVTCVAASRPSAAAGSPPAISPAGPVAFRKDRRLTSSSIAISPLRECNSRQGAVYRVGWISARLLGDLGGVVRCLAGRLLQVHQLIDSAEHLRQGFAGLPLGDANRGVHVHFALRSEE